MSARVAIPLALLAALAVFTIQNTDVVTVRFLFWKVEMSRALMLIAVLVTGAVVGWLLATFRHR